MQERVLKNPKIEILWDAVVEEILGEDPKGVTGVRLRNTKTGERFEEPCDGIFIAIGHVPNTSVFQEKLEVDEKGYILTREGTQTNIPGVFAAGDVQDPKYRQAVTAAGSGCMAALDAFHFLEDDG
jgi:thioredoxin reductase (NADPH)